RLEPGSELYRAMVTGVCTCYSRPFMEASGVGKLPPDFENFDAASGNGTLKKTHTTLLETRHKLAAHHDLDHLQARFNEGKIPLGPGELKILFGKDTTYSVQLQHPFVLPGVIEGVPELVDFQISRLRTALDNQMTTFTRTGETPQDLVIRLKQSPA
ncbi:MAG TPA: hypothetical protein VK968_01505, partial [Roseimicrobium sp.]|nr:hypothetical protein [Roseimicrobium sp.]